MTRNSVVMVSLPMAGKTDKQIRDTWNKAAEHLRRKGYKVLDTIIESADETDYTVNEPLYYLGKSLIYMSLCSSVYFCDGWEEYRGCIIEHGAARAYGLNILYESVGD